MLDLNDYLRSHGLDAEIVDPGAHMPTVEAAAAAMGCLADQISSRSCSKPATAVARWRSPAGARGSTRAGSRAHRTAAAAARAARRGAAGDRLSRRRHSADRHRERFPVVVDRRVVAQPWDTPAAAAPSCW